ncbi:hypothetical protein G9A89_013198 [Geosiphon pyriformis]|nr:hypothetical protein G9A89_013198 [Geosiphon pyriformis]
MATPTKINVSSVEDVNKTSTFPSNPKSVQSSKDTTESTKTISPPTGSNNKSLVEPEIQHVAKNGEAAKHLAEEERDHESEEVSEDQGAVDPDTGEINWDCPCLGGMANGPCGEEFKAAFSCFVVSTAEPKGVDCLEAFKAMQACFRAHPEEYSQELEDDDEDDDDYDSDDDGDDSVYFPSLFLLALC